MGLEMPVGWWRPWDGDGVGVGTGDGGGRSDGGDGDGGGGEVMVRVGMETKVTQVGRLPACIWLLCAQAS